MQVKTKHYILGGTLAVIIGAAFLFTVNWAKSPLAAYQTKPKPVKAGEVEISTFKNIALNLKDKDTKEFFKSAEKETLKLELKAEDTYQSKREFSQIVTPEFDFTAVAPHWIVNAPKDTTVKLAIRINDGKNWSEWQNVQSVDAIRENSKKNPYKQGELVFAKNEGKFFEYKAELTSINPKITPSLEQIKFYYLDASEGPNPLSPKKLFGIIPVASADSDHHFSRSDWGAEESYRYDGGKEKWPRRYALTKAFVIHHTAGANNPSNPAAAVRAIYYYHAITLDWGDIGYNFLVDQYGNTYEGRYGGKNVVGGHAANYNYGTCGISVLGNFETATPTNEILNGIARLINDKIPDTFNPTGTVKLTKTSGYPNYSYLGSKIVPTICSHRDVMSTACPGKNLYAKLSRIRDLVKENQIPAYDYNLVSTSYPPATMLPGETFKVVVKLKNTGQITWYKDGDPAKYSLIALAPSHPKYRKSAFGFDRVRMLEDQVAYGEVATFELNITAPDSRGTYLEYFQPLIHGKVWLADKNLSFKVTISQRDFDYQILENSYTTSVTPREIYNAIIKVKNTGKRTWKNSGETKVRLGTYNPRDRHSVIHVSGTDSGWDGYGRIKLQEPIVKPGQIGTFKFKVGIPWNLTAGDQMESFRLVSENICWFGPKITLKLKVAAVTNYSLSSIEKPPHRMLTGDSARVTIKIKNTGNTVWYKEGNYKKIKVVTLAASRPKHRTSAFGFKRIRMQETEVKPGEVATFTFNIKAPKKSKYYKEYLQPVWEGKGWLKDKGINFKTKVEKPRYQYSIVTFKRPPKLMGKGSQAQVVVKIKNKSNFSWYNTGINPMKLAIDNKRKSSFSNQSWNNSQSISMDQTEVKAGHSATFTFTVTAPDRPGKYLERFVPVLSGKKRFADKGIAFKIQVPGYVVKVGIAHSNSPQNPSGNIKITSSNSYTINDSEGNLIKNCDGGSIVSIGIRNDIYHVYYNSDLIKKTSNYIIATPKSSGILSVPSYTGVGYSVNGDRSFRGNLIVRYSSYSDQYYPAALWLINQLDVEDYLKGLAEQSDSSGSETLKLMMVVARTYAIYNIDHPKSLCEKRGFNLFNNAYSQVYKGYEMERRSSNVSAAVDATRGTIITYKDNPIVAAYSSRCGGSTSSLTGYPYLKGKTCSPHRCSGKRLGHGWGMCMEGARNKIAHGWGYREVIHFYYTGVSIRDFY